MTTQGDKFVWKSGDITIAPPSSRKSLEQPPIPVLDYWKRYDALMSQIGNVWLNDYMQKAYQAVSHSAGGSMMADVQTALDGLHDDFKAALIGTSEQTGPLVKLIMAGMGAGQEAINHGSAANPNRPVSAKALEIDWGLLAQDAFNFARQYVFDLIHEVDETTRKYVQETEAKWIESGESLDSFKDSLRQVFTDKARADAIAETESTRAYVTGAKERYRRADVKKVKLSTLNDSLVCDICAPLEGTTVPLSEGWASATGTAFPPFHVRCRHWIIPADGGD